MPCRSPGCGVALPDLEMRAPTTTRGKPDSFNPGAIAIESSSEKATGRSRTCLRSTASGIGGPSAARAKMNTASSGEVFCFSLDERLIVPFRDRKSTRLNSSHVKISYAVFCLKKKTDKDKQQP